MLIILNIFPLVPHQIANHLLHRHGNRPVWSRTYSLGNSNFFSMPFGTLAGFQTHVGINEIII